MAFLNTLTRSIAFDRHRQTQAQWRLQERWSLDDSQKHRSDLMDKLTLQEISCQVQAAMAELSTNQRTVVDCGQFNANDKIDCRVLDLG